jgi:hypothetical protein
MSGVPEEHVAALLKGIQRGRDLAPVCEDVGGSAGGCQGRSQIHGESRRDVLGGDLPNPRAADESGSRFWE